MVAIRSTLKKLGFEVVPIATPMVWLGARLVIPPVTGESAILFRSFKYIYIRLIKTKRKKRNLFSSTNVISAFDSERNACIYFFESSIIR